MLVRRSTSIDEETDKKVVWEIVGQPEAMLEGQDFHHLAARPRAGSGRNRAPR